METSFGFQDGPSLKEAEATEAIKEAKAHCGATIREAESHCNTCIREAETDCTSITTEAEAHCTADIRRVESHCAEHAHSIQQLHAEGIQPLETEAMEEEGRDHLPFLTAHGMALQACLWGTNGPPPFTPREHVLGYSSEHSPSGVFH